MGMCIARIETWINRLTEEADSLLELYRSEEYICEIKLARMESVVRDIRYEFEKDKNGLE